MTLPWNPPERYQTSTPQEYFIALGNFINKYKFVYQHKSIEFFTKAVWESTGIPESWKEPLLSLTPEEASVFPQGKSIQASWPQSLIEFLQEAQALVLPRAECCNFPAPAANSECIPTNNATTEKPMGTSNDRLAGFSLPSLSRNMSAKKIHEVLKLSALIAHVAKNLGSDSGDDGDGGDVQGLEVVDVGSGEGYLGQVLHHEHGMTVVGVDERSEFTEGAQRRAHFIRQESEARARKASHAAGDEPPRMSLDERLRARAASAEQYKVKNVVACITLDLDPRDFERIAWPESSPDKCILVGLHTCGVLANSMLRLFVLSSKINAIVDVGCCYYRKQPDYRYEMMSEAGRTLARALELEMTAGALKLACEAVMIAEGSIADFEYSMESHFYRTVLETALVKHFPNGHNFNIRGLPRKKSQSFKEYCGLAVKRIMTQKQKTNESTATGSAGIDVDQFLEQLQAMYTELQPYNPHVNATLLLRSVLSPVLESFLLMDRWLYLKESGTSPYLIPIFNETLSPRNVAVVAFKT